MHLLRIVLKGNVVVSAAQTALGIVCQRSPVGLNDDTFVLHDFLELAGDLTTCLHVGSGQCLCQCVVKFLVVETRFIPCLSGTIGQAQNLYAKRTMVPVG